MPRERIAIVGSGITGLSAARFLSPRHDVTLIDSSARPGGHAHTVRVTEPGTGAEKPMDVGFMVFNEVTYPLLCRLFRELGVQPKPTSMSFSVRHDPTGLEWSGSSLSHLFSQRRNLLNPRFWRLLLQINRFNALGAQAWKTPEAERMPLSDWCAHHGLNQDFLDLYLVPMSSAVWSTPPERMLAFPAAKLLRFFHNHGFLGLHTQHPWLTLEGGSETYVRALLAQLKATVRLGQPVEGVRRADQGAELRVGGAWERFDRIVLATHADLSLRLLSDADGEERRVLGAFAYNDNIAHVHTDMAPLPRTTKARASWNVRTWDENGRRLTSTHYWMNSLQGVSDRENYIVTINHAQQINPAKVLQTIPCEHPLFSLEALAAQGEIPALNARPGARVHFCGAWQRYGFHEDGIWSAHQLCTHLLGGDPW
ncbi:MAG: NAD(P)/FAD-dependent oxidoreductase [Opitutales bacterium]